MGQWQIISFQDKEKGHLHHINTENFYAFWGAYVEHDRRSEKHQ